MPIRIDTDHFGGSGSMIRINTDKKLPYRTNGSSLFDFRPMQVCLNKRNRGLNLEDFASKACVFYICAVSEFIYFVPCVFDFLLHISKWAQSQTMRHCAYFEIRTMSHRCRISSRHFRTRQNVFASYAPWRKEVTRLLIRP